MVILQFLNSNHYGANTFPKRLRKSATREKENTRLERTDKLTPLGTNVLHIHRGKNTTFIHKLGGTMSTYKSRRYNNCAHY